MPVTQPNGVLTAVNSLARSPGNADDGDQSQRFVP
jgi:hypothetical protein